MKLACKLAMILVLIGAVNWGFIGLFKFDFISRFLGGMDCLLPRIIFSLVGLAGFFLIYNKLSKRD